MKKIQGFLIVAAFAVAIGGAFAMSDHAVLPGFREPVGGGACSSTNVPENCATSGTVECSIGAYKYYQNINPETQECENVYFFKN